MIIFFSFYHFDLLYLFSFLMFSFILSCLLLFLSMGLVGRTSDIEKLSSYECGFDPFEDSRGKFDIRFYLVSILFLIFDIEIVFFFPWSVSLFYIGFWGFFSMWIFFFLLLVGFLYEILRGALEWN